MGRPTAKIRTKLGERIAIARQTAKLTQRELADKLTAQLDDDAVVTQRMVAYWEREAVSLRADQLDALADILGVTTDVLVGRQDHDPLDKARAVFKRVSKLRHEDRDEIVEVVRFLVAQKEK